MRLRLTVTEKRTRRGRQLVSRVRPDWIDIGSEPEHVREVLPRVLDDMRRRGRRKA